jgi:hypothetical protein
MNLDFVTVIFNDQLELNLLKLQAYSFKFVDIQIINKIWIICNDLKKINFEDIIQYYPYNYREKVNIIYNSELNLAEIFLTEKGVGWQMQQLLKLYVSNYIENDYYCVLDAKNHFLKKISCNDFFSIDNNYYLFTSCGCEYYYYYMENCLNYFSLDSEYYKKIDTFISMSTPFIFETSCVKEMMLYIEKKECMQFKDFFIKNNNITEFYLYSSYIVFKEKKNHTFKEIIHTSIHKNPNEYWSQYFIKNQVYKEDNWKIFGLHRYAPDEMSNDYKKNVLEMYECFYDDNMIEFIKKSILSLN